MVVGAGAAGTLTAMSLLDRAGRRGRALTVVLVDPRERAGRGVAYSTEDDRHLLNVPVAKMSGYPEDAGHFHRWLSERRGCEVDPGEFAPRVVYGEYLESLLSAAAARVPWCTLDQRVDSVSAVQPTRTGATVTLASGDRLEADAVVLAIGHLGADAAWAPAELLGSDRFVADPWAPGALDRVPETGDVLLVGTGLTAVDCVATVARPDRRVIAISRRGQLPHRHAAAALPAMEAPELPDAPDPVGLEQLRTAMAAHLAKATARYGDWRPAIDSLRPLTASLWSRLPIEDRQTFLAEDARAWDCARHRMPAATAQRTRELADSGALDVRAATVVAACAAGTGPDGAAGLEVTLSDGSVVTVAAVVDCTGPGDRPSASGSPLVAGLLQSGVARPGPLGIGLDTDADGALVGVRAGSRRCLWTLGSLRRGSLWESTAIPEIRAQAAALAVELVGSRTTERKPRDRYGLGVSTTPEVAESWQRAVDRIVNLRQGAHAELRQTVALDPGFAMGHATLALLGHQWGLPVDIDASLRDAQSAVAYRGDSRERSFVRTVTAMLTQPASCGDSELSRHVREHPLDALAVSMALPTIAFDGLTQPVEESWALVDRLAESYGRDVWFTGVRAFFAQERRRYDEAELLSAQALAAQPDSGHAAHARTHVFYETGEHRAGLEWIDSWIGEHGDASAYPAHYSWHAALHELSLDDAGAIARRYARELAPPRVRGPRALVDSASMLWRSRLAGLWSGPVPIDEVLDVVPSCLLERPATAFAAMHAVVALAAAGDEAKIRRLAAYAAARTDDSVFPEVVRPLSEGAAALVAGDSDTAARVLAPLPAVSWRLGGSAAQQQVVEDTALTAFLEAGQAEQARVLLERRLDRRASPCDSRRLAQLPAPA